MHSDWIILSTRWSLSSVQASLNVIISVLGTVGVWAFGRYWWRRGGVKVLHNQTGVPLSKLFTIAGPGESWDVLATLRRKIFDKENWHLLVQLIVVVCITVACALAGPIAKVSLRNGVTVQSKELQVLHSVKGGGAYGNLLYSTLLWNDTAQSLKDAVFPDDQLLDFLPPPITPPWMYIANEWDPTWTVSCNYTENVRLENVTGSGENSIFDPVNAFPAFRETYPATWLDTSKYRMTSDYNSWQNWNQERQFQEVLFYILVQSDPQLDDRMLHNNESMRLSLSVLHASDFRVLYEDTSGIGGEDTWKPVGSVGSASYSRAECELVRRPHVEDEDRIPWPWTNDTLSIMSGYRNFFHDPFVAAAVKKRTVTAPSARDLFRFYQVYMASINTFHSDPSPKVLSVRVQTVELSTAFLAILILLFMLTTWSSLRYAWFLRRNKKQLADLYVPDGKIEWMIHAVKTSESGLDLEANMEGKKCKDSDHFCAATFGPANSDGPFNPDLQMPRLARVRSGRSSISGSDASLVRKYSVSPARSHVTNLSSLDENDDGHNNLWMSPRSEHTLASPDPETLSPPRSPRTAFGPLSRVPSIDVQCADEDDTTSKTLDLGLSTISSHSSSTLSVKPMSNSGREHHVSSCQKLRASKPDVGPSSSAPQSSRMVKSQSPDVNEQTSNSKLESSLTTRNSSFENQRDKQLVFSSLAL